MQSKRDIFKAWPKPLRKQVALFIQECRKRDRQAPDVKIPWLSQSRTLKDYCNRLEVSQDFVEAFLEARLQDLAPLRIFDVGVGEGGALQDLSNILGNHLALEGIGLTHNLFSLPTYTHHVGLIENTNLSEHSFDLIFSVRGGFAYTLNSFAAAENVLNSLKLGGIAFIEDSRLLLSQDWFRGYLRSQGFECEETRYEQGKAVAFKIINLENPTLNLVPFLKRYEELILKNADVFLKWGFDRIQKDSPVTAVLQSLYSFHHYQDLLEN